MPATGMIPWRESRRMFGAAGWSLGAGAVILAVLLAANIATYFTPAERVQDAFQYEPSHVLLLQRLFSPPLARENVVHLLGEPNADAPGVRVFRNHPSSTTRTGEPYEYRPQPSRPLSEYSLQGQPDGLALNATTGAISGRPGVPGKYDMILSARLTDDQLVEQHFTLFVDDRFLVLGADNQGRDVLMRIGSSAKYTIVPGLIAVIVSVIGGTLLGALGGFYGGVAQRVLQGATAVIQSVPGLILIFLAGAISNYDIYTLMIVAGLILLPETANGVFERVESFRKRDFVEAARELGMRDRTILWNEIVWHNVRSFLLTRVTQGFVFAILVDVTVSYLGLMGRELPRLGGMLVEGREALFGDHTTLLAAASLATVLLIIAGFTLAEKGILGLWERRR